MWHVTCDTWQMTHYMWPVTYREWWTLSKNFRSLFWTYDILKIGRKGLDLQLMTKELYNSPCYTGSVKYTARRASLIQLSWAYIFPFAELRTLAWQLWEFTRGCAAEVSPLNVLITRTHQIWQRVSLSAMCSNMILKVDILLGKLQWLTKQEKNWSASPLCCLNSSSSNNFYQDAFGEGPCDAFPYCHPSELVKFIGHKYISWSAMFFETSIYSASASAI